MRLLQGSFVQRTAQVKKPEYKPIITKAAFEQKEPDAGNSVVCLSSNDYVFHQVTALSSCQIDGFIISSDTTKFINDNNNAWSHTHLKQYYSSFIGGHNYYEHQQEPSKSLGFICDARIRPVKINEEGVMVYYCDLLIATNISKPYNHTLTENIARGQITTFSMGCESTSIRCSRCGLISEDSENDCNHLMFQLGDGFLTKEGKDSQTAAIIFDKAADGTQGSIEFYEISYVKDPAFPGAVAGWKVEVPADTKVYFSVPNSALTRPEPMKNGIKYWLDRQCGQIVK
jgi:hypothetical protein